MRHKQLLLTSFLLLCLGISWIIGHEWHIFTVKKIECTVDQQQPCPDFLQADLEKNIGKSIFLTDFSVQLQRIAQIMPSFAQATFQQQLPDKVVVHFLSTQPQYAVKSSSGSSLFLVDQTGTLTDQVQQTNLPILQLPEVMFQGLSLRAQLPSQLHQASETLFISIKQHGLQTTEVTAVSPAELTLTLSNQLLARLSTDQVNQEITKLVYILNSSNLTTIKVPIKEIDLRFRYPVIKT